MYLTNTCRTGSGGGLITGTGPPIKSGRGGGGGAENKIHCVSILEAFEEILVNFEISI